MVRNLDNIILPNIAQSERYSTEGRGPERNFPERVNYNQHGNRLKSKLQNIFSSNPIVIDKPTFVPYKEGIKVTFMSRSGYDLKIESLENIQQNIRVINVDKTGESILVTVFIPDESRSFFINRIEDYLNDDKANARTGARRHAALINSIEDVTETIVSSFWNDGHNPMPDDNKEWCEFWLWFDEDADVDSQKLEIENTLSNFRDLCDQLDIVYKDQEVIFPECVITLALVNKNDITELVKLYNQISEIRLNTEVNEFFLNDLDNIEQKEWISDLLDRVTISENNEFESTSICILDSGVNTTHPIINPFIKTDSRVQSVVEPIDSVDDLLGHGTQMAGVAIFNDLKAALEERNSLNVNHTIESVKILPDSGRNEESLFGAITSDAVMSAEIESPKNNKVYCMAITSDSNGPLPGSPTQWSATVDWLSHGENNNRRLFLISGGNIHPITYSESGVEYPELNSQYNVENPAQSWNALTIGAYNKNSVFINDDKAVDFEPVSKNNELSPFSSTSVLWDSKTPIKPEVLFDGGNMIKNSNGDYDSHDNHSLLTANHKIETINPKYFSTINATSSATAQASNFTARLWNEYSDLWPETIRGLVVHSANWTDEMINQFKYNDKKTSGVRNLIRHTGYGVPDYDKAIFSQNNSVNLIAESEIQPYIKDDSRIRYNEANFYKIPWPKDELEFLDSEKIRLKVTLSYFIEPSPNKVGWTSKYIYPSYRFGFDLIRPTETLEEFQARISKELRYDDYKTTSSSLNWFIGPENRNNGSVHSDYIEDTAINLSDSNYIVVYPQGGWWKERKKFNRFNDHTRYSLIITLETVDKEIDINLYQPIMNQIEGLIEL